jgi:hypothetical protein
LRRTGLVWLIGALLLPLAGASAETKRIFPIPPIQWDNAMLRDKPAQIFGPSDLGALTGGIVFGLSPPGVNAKLPTPAPGIEWAGLPFANEYPEDVRYFWVRLDSLRELRDGINGCVGVNSYVVFLFRAQALFRVSWRLLPDATCPSAHDAAEDIYGRYLTLDRAASVAIHYRAGTAEVVEITDPHVDELIPYRWENRRRR